MKSIFSSVNKHINFTQTHIDASSLPMRPLLQRVMPTLIHWPAGHTKSNQSIADMLLYVQCSCQPILSEMENQIQPDF